MNNLVINKYGDKVWYNNKGYLHNEIGPAIIYSDGTQVWMINGKRHRIDGPAAIDPDGTQNWYVNNRRYKDNQSYQKAAGITDEDMLVIVSNYGNVE